MLQGSKEHGLFGALIMILATWCSVRVEKVAKIGVRIPGGDLL